MCDLCISGWSHRCNKIFLIASFRHSFMRKVIFKRAPTPNVFQIWKYVFSLSLRVQLHIFSFRSIGSSKVASFSFRFVSSIARSKAHKINPLNCRKWCCCICTKLTFTCNVLSKRPACPDEIRLNIAVDLRDAHFKLHFKTPTRFTDFKCYAVN